jgi:hypothetical protein
LVTGIITTYLILRLPVVSGVIDSYLADFPKWRQLFQMHKLAVIVGDVRELRLNLLVYFRVRRHLGGALAVPYQAHQHPSPKIVKGRFSWLAV